MEVSTRRPQYVRRSTAEGLRDAHRPTRIGFIPKVLIWGCFNERGLGCFRLLTSTMNSARFVETLENALIPSANIWFGDSADFVFQQDNAPCHKSRDIRKFFEENQMTVMDWPPYSPDLNPIENLWAILKSKLRQKSYSSVDQLSREVNRLWNDDPSLRSHCSALSRSMVQRVADCIRLKGGATKY